jgi:hypothetical protein
MIPVQTILSGPGPMTPIRSLTSLASAGTLLLLAACAGAPTPTDTAPPEAAARAALDAMLADGRRAHLETDAGRLAAGLADSLVSLDAGVVSVQPRDSVQAMFARYFAGAHYRAWEDVEPPRVNLSADRSLAWVSRVVCVDREEPDDSGGRRRRVFVSGYSATFAWQAGRYWMTTVTSTVLPEPPERCPSSGA